MTLHQVEGAFRARLDGSPVLRIESPQLTDYDAPSVSSFFECLDRGLERHDLLVVLHDVRGIPPVDERRRQDFMAHLEPRRARVERQIAAYAAVCGSPLERGLITAFSWFIRLSLPIRIFTSEAEARQWLLLRHEAARRARHLSSAIAGLE